MGGGFGISMGVKIHSGKEGAKQVGGSEISS